MRADWSCGGDGVKLAGSKSPVDFMSTGTTFSDFRFPSNIYSVDWFFRPFSKVEISGMFFHGRNVAVLGGLRQGFTMSLAQTGCP